MAISSKDIETLWGRYQSEGVSKGVSVSQYFEANGIPYHVFEKLYKKRVRSQTWSIVSLTVFRMMLWQKKNDTIQSA